MSSDTAHTQTLTLVESGSDPVRDIPAASQQHTQPPQRAGEVTVSSSGEHVAMATASAAGTTEQQGKEGAKQGVFGSTGT